MEIIDQAAAMQAWSEAERSRGLRLGFVPTMGYLHEGHLDLVRHARRVCDRVVVSIFVNPKQFGPKEDLSTYPRDMARDLSLLEGCGVDVVFTPGVEEIYPPGFQTRVEVTEVTRGLCGAFRPDFFPGVATVVLKLFNLTRPHFAVFGEKDYQQLVTIKRMVSDLHLPIEVEGRPTVREPDGLAMSSRNVYLKPEERDSARSLSQALGLARDLVARGVRDTGQILGLVRGHIESRPMTRVQYAVIVDRETMAEVSEVKPGALLALAVFVGATRLIDNGVIEEG
jgi:pantoate--beta-alanine ligase